jgi:hypothetical protein
MTPGITIELNPTEVLNSTTPKPVTEMMLLKDTVSDQTLISHSELIILNNPKNLI